MSAAPKYLAGGRPEGAPAPRLFVHRDYVRMLRGKRCMELTGFLSILLTHSVESPQEGRTALLVDATRATLADDAGCHPDTVRRLEKALMEAGVVRQVGKGAARRVLEILPPSTSVLRPSEVCSPAHLKRGGEPVGNPVENGRGSEVEVCSPAHLRGAAVHTSGVQPCTPHGSASLYALERRKEGKSERARERATDSTSSGAEHPSNATAAARRLVGEAQARIAQARARGRDCAALGARRGEELRRLLARRWHRYQFTPAAADRALERDFDRILGYALSDQVQSPAAYLLRIARGGDWKATSDPESTAAVVAARGQEAELPVQDLHDRAGPDADAEDPEVRAAAFERLDQARSRVEASLRIPRSTRASLLGQRRPMTAAGANAQATALETALLTAGGED